MTRKLDWRRMGLAVVCVLVACAGCQKQDGGRPKPSAAKERPVVDIASDESPPETASSKRPAEEKAKPADQPAPPPPPTIPKVSMTETQLETCLVKVGDVLPDAELPDLDGKARPRPTLSGKQATVVLYWTADNLYALQALQDLQLDVAEPYASKGVAVIGVSVKGQPDDARKAIADTGAKYPIVLDADGRHFAKIATGKPPRIFLLDAGGKVLWFDIEYSPTTRRQLTEALKAVTGEK